MRRGPTLKALQKIVDRFNAEFPVGSKVMLRKDSGEVETEVRAPAEVLQGHSAVGWFVGVSGCYSIDNNRVRALATVWTHNDKGNGAAATDVEFKLQINGGSR